ncbi:major capsid protein E [Bacillus phage vB_BpsM-61]|nr:major capsid protein E [Bacillus phage vB_BpsM-61]
MPLHLEEFQGEEFLGYVENVPQRKEDKLQRFLPDDTVYDTEFTYNIINGSYGKMASITAWDSGAPLRDKETLERMTAELGKVQHSYRLTEKELLMFNRPRAASEKDKAIEQVYNQTDRLVWGVYDRAKWFRAKAVYSGALTFSENGVDLDVDFGIPEENKLVPDTAWDNAGASPLRDIQTAVQQFKDQNNGDLPEVIHMNGTTESLMLQHDDVKAQIFGTANTSRITTPEHLQGLLSSLSLPPYEVNDDRVQGDNGMEKLIPDNRLVLLGDDLGNLMYGITVEKNYEPGIYVIPEIQETNPPRQTVFVGASMFPALQRTSAIVYLDVL